MATKVVAISSLNTVTSLSIPLSWPIPWQIRLLWASSNV